jgi:multisubunit Na+/H+ antiporter MnhE subunit
MAVLVSSDFYASKFWLGHPVTAAILASLAVVLVSVTVIEVVLNRRSERRWRLLAQYALLELAEGARGAWGVLLGVIYEESTRLTRS